MVNVYVGVYVGLQRYPYIRQLGELARRRRLTQGQPGAPRWLGRVRKPLATWSGGSS